MRVIVVDDDPSVLQMIERMLVHHGHEVTAVSTPYGVSALVQREQPDVVLLDVMMPGLSGTALVELISRLDLPKPPALVLCSAMPEDQLRDAARKAGGLAYVSKPRGVGAIVAAVEAAAARRG